MRFCKATRPHANCKIMNAERIEEIIKRRTSHTMKTAWLTGFLMVGDNTTRFITNSLSGTGFYRLGARLQRP
jgi:hypothetical protein